jgi:hypothetical protein
MEEKRHGLFELGRPDPLLTIFDRPRPERLMTGTRQDFSRDGRYIVWGNTDGTVTVADLTVIHSALAEFKLDW